MKSKKSHFIQYIFAFLIVLGCIKFFIFHGVIADGRALAVTGWRVISGDYSLLYEPISGSGNFIYFPTASLFFVPFSFFTISHNPYFSFNLFSGTAYLSFIAIIYFLCFKNKKIINAIGIAMLVLVYFGSLVWESIYIGQIDLQLTFLLICGLFLWPNKFIGYFLNSIVVLIKPQFILLGISRVKNHSTIRFLTTLVALQFLLTLLFLNLSNYSIGDLISHIDRFYDMAKNGLVTGGGG